MQENEIKILGLINEDGYESVNRVYDTDGLSPTINTCQGGNHEPKILLIRQATKEGYIPCKIGGGGRPGISNQSNTQRKGNRSREYMSNTDNSEYP